MIYTTQHCCDITQMLLYWVPCRQWDIIIFFFLSVIKCDVRDSVWETHHGTRVVIFILLGQRLLWGHWSVSLWGLKDQPFQNPALGRWAFPFHTGLHQNWEYCWLGGEASTGLHLKAELGLKTCFLNCKSAEAVAQNHHPNVVVKCCVFLNRNDSLIKIIRTVLQQFRVQQIRHPTTKIKR